MMNPHFLQKQIRDNASDLESFCKDLKQWKIDMEKKDRKNKTPEKEDVKQPKVRKVSGSSSSSKKKAKGEKPKRISTIDYSSWDKFDADAECARLDEESGDESELTDECDNQSIDLANVEKEKGNNFVKNKEWDKAIECYSAAIKLYTYDPVFYSNRALCYLKLNNFQSCEEDCNKALRLDGTYVKALHRRALAREHLGALSEAHQDLQNVLKIEPNNKESKKQLELLEKKLEEVNKSSCSNDEVQRPKSKFTMSRQKKEKINLNTTQKAQSSQAVEEIRPVQSRVVERKPIVNESIGKVIERKEEEPKPQTSKIQTAIWPTGDNVELVETIYKPPNQRSKRKLKRIQVVDVEKTTITEIDPPCLLDEQKPVVEIKHDDKIMKKIEVIKEDVDETENELITPKTAVQFCDHWKKMGNLDAKIQYLKLIDPDKFSELFKESLSTNLFTDIISTLAQDEKKQLNSYRYLLGLTQVKRFGALVMFMSREDKKNLFTLLDFMRDDNSLDQGDVNILLEKYEL